MVESLTKTTNFQME